MAYTNIDKGSDYFETVTYTGTGSSLSISSLDFTPDLVWIKSRSAATEHVLTDSVRGVTKEISSDDNGAEETVAQGLTAFNSDGFTVGTDGSYNTNSATYVSWSWLGGGTASSNSDGSITSSVSANTTSGFSIVSWTGTGTNPSTIGHGLGTAPSCIILKNIDASGGSGDWYVGHDGIGWTDRLKLNTTAVTAASSTLWNDTAPNSSVFTISSALNFSGDSTIAYCFAEKKGFSKFGSYTGNGNADGPFVYTGMKPSFVMVKGADGISDWGMWDIKRNIFNVSNSIQRANTSDAQVTLSPNNDIDILSNGLKVRSTTGLLNVSGNDYIYMAFAENPFVTSTGIPATAR